MSIMRNVDIQSMSENEIAKQYMPLINKIAGQINKASGYDFQECVSAGYLGIMHAIRTYKNDVGAKKQTFTQYAGYMIRFFILNDMNKHGHIIRVNQDQQKRLKEEGKSPELVCSLDKAMGHDEEGECTLNNVIPGDTEESIYNSIDPSESDIWETIYNKLDGKFNNRDLDVFYSTFGVNGHEEMKGKDIAQKYGISAGAVTQIRNKIINFMKADRELRNSLLEILQMIG